MRPRPAVALILGLLAGCTLAGAEDRAQFVSRLDLPRYVEGFGGLSGLEISDDGSRFIAVSDRGSLFRGRIERQGGDLAGVVVESGQDLAGSTDTQTDPGAFDSEGVAVAPDGRLYVSYEGRNRVVAYDAAMSRGQELPRPPGFRQMEGNAGLEALAVDAAARLYTLPERSGHPLRPFPLWRFDGEWTRIGEVPRHPPFLPVGADFGPDGRLYLLERHFTGMAFRSRVRSFEVGRTGLTDERVELETPGGRHGNLEGIATWRDGDGAIRLTMVADDNFLSVQANELVEYVLPLAPRGQTN